MISKTQRSSTLVVSMIMLVVLMLLGVMAMTTSDTAYKLAGNLQFENNAFNNAEAALSDAENSLQNGTISINDFPNPSLGLYPKDANIDPFNMAWNDSDSFSLSSGDTQRRIVQLMSEGTVQFGENVVVGVTPSTGCKKVNTYMITARGTSARGSTKLVRSYYSVLTPTACQ